MSELTILSGHLISPPEPRRTAPAATIVESDADYFERRASEGLLYALGLADPRCRAIHIELASHYAQRAAAIRQSEAQTD